jgi:hypothetical protein
VSAGDDGCLDWWYSEKWGEVVGSNHVFEVCSCRSNNVKIDLTCDSTTERKDDQFDKIETIILKLRTIWFMKL